MSKYMTKQRKILYEYLASHADEQISLKQIAAELADEGISLSALYRNLADLQNEGLIKRCQRSNTKEVFYQYIADEECSDCLHLACKICGKTFHMESNNAKNLIAQVF